MEISRWNSRDNHPRSARLTRDQTFNKFWVLEYRWCEVHSLRFLKKPKSWIQWCYNPWKLVSLNVNQAVSLEKRNVRPRVRTEMSERHVNGDEDQPPTITEVDAFTRSVGTYHVS